MNVNIVATENFKREAKPLIKKFSSLKSELDELQSELEKTPDMGIQIGEDVYKIRLAVKSKGKGKSGGMRIITYVRLIISHDLTKVYLLSIYDKSDVENISEKSWRRLADEVDEAIMNEPLQIDEETEKPDEPNETST